MTVTSTCTGEASSPYIIVFFLVLACFSSSSFQFQSERRHLDLFVRFTKRRMMHKNMHIQSHCLYEIIYWWRWEVEQSWPQGFARQVAALVSGERRSAKGSVWATLTHVIYPNPNSRRRTTASSGKADLNHNFLLIYPLVDLKLSSVSCTEEINVFPMKLSRSSFQKLTRQTLMNCSTGKQAETWQESRVWWHWFLKRVSLFLHDSFWQQAVRIVMHHWHDRRISLKGKQTCHLICFLLVYRNEVSTSIVSQKLPSIGWPGWVSLPGLVTNPQ